MQTAPLPETHEVSRDAGARIEAMEVLFSSLVKSLHASDPMAIERFVQGMKRAALVPGRVRYRGRPLGAQTWQCIEAVIDDLDRYIETR